MKLAKYAAIVTLAVGLSSTAFAQPPVVSQQGDRVDRLDRLVDLTDAQKADIRDMMQTAQAKIAKLNLQARKSQQQLVASIKPDFDEESIRQQARDLGELTGKISAESALLQARIQHELTDDQRATLEQKVRERRQQIEQMRKQMQQQPQQPGGQ